MTAHSSISSPQRAADAGRGLLALLGIVALVAGVPALLVGWVGSPLPAGVPTVSEVAHAVRDTFVPEALLVKALALVCWLVWVELLASLLVEAVAYARGRKAAVVPLAGGLQRGAARLVAAAALLGAAIATRGGAGPAPLAGQPLVVADLAVAPVAVAPVAVEAGVLAGAEHRHVDNLADSAARAGAQVISEDAVRAGSPVVLDPAGAVAATCGFLADAGEPCGGGTGASVDGNRVTVTVRSTIDLLLLPGGAKPVAAEGTACVAIGITDAAPC
ncbi:MAG TPA: hypothetical protein VFZ77_09450 [Acidimicrobiales bacterium]